MRLWQLLPNFAKSFILDVPLGPGYASGTVIECYYIFPIKYVTIFWSSYFQV